MSAATPGQADPWQVITDVMSELLRGGQTAGIRCQAALQVLADAGIDFDGNPVAVAAREPHAADGEADLRRRIEDVARGLDHRVNAGSRTRMAVASSSLARILRDILAETAAGPEPQPAPELAERPTVVHGGSGKAGDGPVVTVEALAAAIDGRDILVKGSGRTALYRAARPRDLAVQLLTAVDTRLTDDPEPQPAPELAAASDRIVRDILESLCRRDGLSLESAVVPGEPARNYELAGRLGIGQVFGLEDVRPQPAPELASLATVMGLSIDQAAEVHKALDAVNVSRAAVAPELTAYAKENRILRDSLIEAVEIGRTDPPRSAAGQRARKANLDNIAKRCGLPS